MKGKRIVLAEKNQKKNQTEEWWVYGEGIVLVQGLELADKRRIPRFVVWYS